MFYVEFITRIGNRGDFVGAAGIPKRMQKPIESMLLRSFIRQKNENRVSDRNIVKECVYCTTSSKIREILVVVELIVLSLQNWSSRTKKGNII